MGLTVDQVISHEVELATRRFGLILHVLAVPCHRQSVAHWEAGDVILVVDTSESVLVLERSPGEVATIDVSTSNQRDLLGNGELRSERFRFLVSILIDSKVDCCTISILLVSQDDEHTYHFRKIEEMKRLNWWLRPVPHSGSK